MSETVGTAVYEIEAHDAAQALCRILGLFAQQNRPLASVIAHSSADGLHAMLRLCDVDAQRASILAEKLRAMAMVERVEFTFSPLPAVVAMGSGARRRLLRGPEKTQHVAAGHLADVLR